MMRRLNIPTVFVGADNDPLAPPTRLLQGEARLGRFVSERLGTNSVSVGGLFRIVWLQIDGTGLDGLYSIYQGNLCVKRPPIPVRRAEGKRNKLFRHLLLVTSASKQLQTK